MVRVGVMWVKIVVPLSSHPHNVLYYFPLFLHNSIFFPSFSTHALYLSRTGMRVPDSTLTEVQVDEQAQQAD